MIYGAAIALKSYFEGIGNVLFSSFVTILALLVRITLSYTCKSFWEFRVIALAEAFSWFFLLLICLCNLFRKRSSLSEQRT